MSVVSMCTKIMFLCVSSKKIVLKFSLNVEF